MAGGEVRRCSRRVLLIRTGIFQWTPIKNLSAAVPVASRFFNLWRTFISNAPPIPRPVGHTLFRPWLDRPHDNRRTEGCERDTESWRCGCTGEKALELLYRFASPRRRQIHPCKTDCSNKCGVYKAITRFAVSKESATCSNQLPPARSDVRSKKIRTPGRNCSTCRLMVTAVGSSS
jgi:hypothetical protein